MKSIILVAILIVSAYSQEANDEKSINPAGCGRRLSSLIARVPSEAPGKVVGGKEAIVGDWNWMVLLKYNGRFLCGSSLINSRWVLTATHCTVGRTAPSLSVELGVHDQYAPESWVISRNIEKLIQHPNYKPFVYHNDISLLKMTSPVTYSTYIGPVCLAAPEVDYSEKYAMATGWGALWSGGPMAQKLQEVSVLVRKDSDCVAEHAAGQIELNSMICAGVRGDSLDTCQNDSGGPLTINDSNDVWSQLGIVSWGIGCGDIGVYTRIQNFIPWILTQIQS